MGEHYFSPEPHVKSLRRTVRLKTWGCDVELVTDSGLFSPKRIDAGTQRLLDAQLVDTVAERILDLGCGYGPIALALAYRYPASSIAAIDVNERARQLTQENVDRLGVKNVRVMAPQEVPGDETFSVIYTNPPIKSGKQAFFSLCEEWFPRLQPSGTAYLVIAKNLGADSLTRGLQEAGWSVKRVSSGGGYRIFALGGGKNER